MLRIDWATPKITVKEFDDFLSTYLDTNYDGVLLANNYLWIRVLEQLTSEQEAYITNWVDNINERPALAVSIADQVASYLPSPQIWKTGQAPLAVDPEQKQLIRGQILTDEGSFRDDFSGVSLFKTLSGSYEFDANTSIVTTADGDLSDEVTLYPYIKKSTEPDSCFTQGRVLTSTSFNLDENYLGETGQGECVLCNWYPESSNCDISVFQSKLNIASTQANSFGRIFKAIDYLPVRVQFKLNLSARISGQTVIFGVSGYDKSIKAYVQLDGTNETQLKFITSTEESAYETQTSVVYIPLGGTTKQDNIYTIEVSNGISSLYINTLHVATHQDHVPDAYDILGIIIEVQNETIVSNNVLKCDWVHFQNIDQIDVVNTFNQSPVKVDFSTKTLDGKPMVSSTSRPIGTYTYLSAQGDSPLDNTDIGGGDLLEIVHNTGDATTQSVYFHVNCVKNETHIHSAVMEWEGATSDLLKGEIVPSTSTEALSAGVSTFYAINSGVLVMAPGNGNIVVDWSKVKLVGMVANEYGKVPPGYWDATFNTTTKLFENIAFNANGSGKYNIFAEEKLLHRFVTAFPLKKDGLYEVKSTDVSQLGHNMKIKITGITRGEDHNWSAVIAMYLFRAKSC
jgi:hypothetical protein